MKRIHCLFPEHATAARERGYEPTPGASVVLVSIDPWIAVQRDVWPVVAAAVERLRRQDHGRRIAASGRAGRPRLFNPATVRSAVRAYGTVNAAAKALGTSPSTIRRYLKCE